MVVMRDLGALMAYGENSFADGQAYDRAMGRLSRIAGERFLEWLSMPASLRWLDVGCGSGSFTELIIQRGAPSTISAIDPSEDQIVVAKGKLSAQQIDYRTGDAMSLPYDDGDFDVAVMALVVQYIPDPDKAMSEITRVVRKGGTVAAYVWPGRAEGHPYWPLTNAFRSIGTADSNRPGNRMRTSEALVDLFASSRLAGIESRMFDIPLEFEDFNDFWFSVTPENYRHLRSSDVDRLKAALRESLPVDSTGRISYGARAIAIRGHVSG
jgi:ubiquinone/menaquinone biosynthesis C-methylase UbiE